MTRLLEKLGILHDVGVPTWYGYYFLWSDDSQRLWIKHKLNNMWFLTITFPSPNVEELAAFHIRALGIDKGNLNHAAVMDWYAKQIKELAGGDDFLRNYKVLYNDQDGPYCLLSIRPEKYLLLKEQRLGMFKLRSKIQLGYSC